MTSYTLNSVLKEINKRFLINVNRDNYYEVFKCLNISYWCYLDDFADIYTYLPKLSFKTFCHKMCKIYLPHLLLNFYTFYHEFNNKYHKTPVAGLILLNENMNNVVLVRSYNTNKWGLPKGKIEEGEDLLECAIREVEEETGFYAKDYIHHPTNKNFFDVSFKDKKMTFYIAKNVPDNVVFKTKTKKEISDIKFFNINEITESCGPTYQIVVKLKRWIIEFNELSYKNLKSVNSSFSFNVNSIMNDIDRVLNNNLVKK
jgi:mRNA-decapping enzyme subunit 2